jgi:biopolymer transport protein ExbD
MRLPRNAKVFRGQLDAAPFVGVTFLLLLFIVLQSKLVFTPVIPIELPEVAAPLPGTDEPTVVLAIDRSGVLYLEHQALSGLDDLRKRLKILVKQSPRPLSLELQQDSSIPVETTAPILGLAQEVGMKQVWLVARPKPEAVFQTQPRK